MQRKEVSEAGSGATGDDADSTEQTIGTKALIHGLSIDSVGRSNVFQTLPAHVRKTLMHFLAEHIPMYNGDYTIDATTGDVTHSDSVAKRLSVSVKDAEDFATSPHTSAFKEYADMPLNKEVNDRVSFYKYNPLASELDPFLMLEPQLYALDSLSHLVSESWAYHIDFLVTLDNEYHRLRDLGPQGTFNESKKKEAWYNLYHKHRDAVKAAYLDTKLVELPAGKINTNWRIVDVMSEIIHKWAPDGSNLRSDILLTVKGTIRGKQGASLGIYPAGSGYDDNDGNPRFYMMRHDAISIIDSAETLPVTVGSTFTSAGDDAFDNAESSRTGASTTNVDSFSMRVDNSSARYLDRVIEAMNSNKATTSLPTTLATRNPSTGQYTKTASVNSMFYGADAYTISRLPGATGGITGSQQPAIANDLTALPHLVRKMDDGTEYNPLLWRGYHINLVDLLELTRKMGRQLEPEAVDFAGRFGLLGTIEQLATRTQGLSARVYDDLINLYAANYAYNENPARVYTAAHLGPVDMTLDPSAGTAISLEGNLLTSKSKSGTLQTVRQRYWTPQRVGPSQAQKIMDRYLPGASMEMGLLGPIAFGSTGSGLKLVQENFIPSDLITALFSTDDSMQTKVEKNVVLRASIPEPEASYASGIGMGSNQLLQEMQMAAVGASMKIGLGHNGYSDISTAEDGTVIYRTAAQDLSITALTLGEKYASSTAVPATYAYVPEVHKLLLREAADIVDASLDDQWDTPIFDEYVTSLYTDAIDKINSAVIPRSELLQGQDHIADVSTNIVSAAHLLPGKSGAATLSPRISISNLLEVDQWGVIQTDIAHDAATPLWDATAMDSDTPNGAELRIFPAKVTTVGINLGGSTQTETTHHSVNNVSAQGAISNVSHKADKDNSGTNNGLTDGVAAFSQYYAQLPMHSAGQLVGSAQGYFTDDSRPGARVNRQFSGIGPTDVLVSSLNTMMNRHREDPETYSMPQIVDSEFGGYKVAFEVTVVASISNASGGTGISNGKQIGYSTQSWELHFADTGDDLDEGSALLAEARTQYKEWNEGPNSGLSATGSFKPLLSEAYDTSFRFAVSAVSAARFLGQTGFSQRTGAGTVKTDWAQTGEITGILPMMEAGGFSGSVISLMAYDPSAKGTRATGVYTNLNVQSKLEISPALLGNLEFKPGAFSQGIYVRGTTSASLMDGLTVSTVYATQPAALGFSTGSGSHVGSSAAYKLEFDNLKGADFVGSMGAGDSSHLGFVGVTTGVYGAVNNGATYTTSSASFSYAIVLTSSGADATWVIPDKPENRMLYRPHRNLVDAAVAAEQKLLQIPFVERLDTDGGVLGLPYFGVPTEFRFLQLVNAGQAQQYILEKSSSATRMIDTSSRGRLSFTKVSLMDPNTERSILPDIVHTLDQVKTARRNALMTPLASDSPVIDVASLRALQSGRQTQRMSNR